MRRMWEVSCALCMHLMRACTYCISELGTFGHLLQLVLWDPEQSASIVRAVLLSPSAHLNNTLRSHSVVRTLTLALWSYIHMVVVGVASKASGLSSPGDSLVRQDKTGDAGWDAWR